VAGLSWSRLALALSDHGGSFWWLLTEANPVAPCQHQNLAMQSQYAQRKEISTSLLAPPHDKVVDSNEVTPQAVSSCL